MDGTACRPARSSRCSPTTIHHPWSNQEILLFTTPPIIPPMMAVGIAMTATMMRTIPARPETNPVACDESQSIGTARMPMPSIAVISPDTAPFRMPREEKNPQGIPPREERLSAAAGNPSGMGLIRSFEGSFHCITKRWDKRSDPRCHWSQHE